MIIASQFKDKTTASLELQIEEIKIPKNEIIPKEIWQKFKKITQKNNDDNSLSLKELKGISELLGKNMIRTVYVVLEVKNKRIFGTYTTKEKAKQVIQDILKGIDKQKIYQMPEDENLGIMLF